MSTSRSVRALAVVFVVLLATPALAGVAAADERAGGTVVVEEGETVTGGLQAVGGTVVVRGTVTGGVEAFAGTVVVAESGTVNGKLQGAGGTIRIAGTVDGRVAVAGGSLVIAESGTVTGDVEAGVGSFVLDGRVDGTVRVGAGSIALGPSASVGGDFVYDGDLTRAPGANIGGELREDPDLSVVGVTGLPAVADWLFTAYIVLLTLAVGALLLLAFPGVSETVRDGAAHSPLRSMAAGFLALAAGPVLFVVLLLTIVGIPLAVLWLAIYVVALPLAFVWGEYAVGAWLLSLGDYGDQWAALAVGVAAVYLVGRVPVLGGLVEFGVLLLGLGGVAVSQVRWARRRRGNGGSATVADAGAESSSDAA
ncbi:MAG: polymer-forming cytoskeletal protein [Halobacterium sp.]